MRLTDHSARSAPTACWNGLRGTVRCSSVAAVEQALPKSRARAGGHGIVLILRACDWSKSLDFIGLWARVHCRIVVLKSAKSRNYSVPKNDPIHNAPNTTALYKAIKDQMVFCDVVLIMAGKYATYSKWIDNEIQIAKGDFNKPIVGIRPWGNEQISSVVSGAADELVGWNTSSIVSAIRKLDP